MPLVLRDVVIVTVSGLILGLAAAAGGMRAVQSQLFGLGSPDGVSFLAASALVVCATLFPCAIASWRVARLAPSEVLRTA